jgi:hypothetical protein
MFSQRSKENAVFRNVTSCGSCKNRHFGGMRHFYLQDGKNQRAVTANAVPSPLILSTLITEAIRSSETRFLQEPRGVTSQKTTFFKSRQAYWNGNDKITQDFRKEWRTAKHWLKHRIRGKMRQHEGVKNQRKNIRKWLFETDVYGNKGLLPSTCNGIAL